MNANWEKRVLPMLQAVRRAGYRRNCGQELPSQCPCCHASLTWGWSEDEFLMPYDPEVVHLTRIPRLDQTVCCPECEGRILN